MIIRTISHDKSIPFLAIMLALMFSFTGCKDSSENDRNEVNTETTTETGFDALQRLEDKDGTSEIRAAVLYNGSNNNGAWQDTFGYLQQSTLLNLEASTIDVSKAFSLEDLDIIYLDSSISTVEDIPQATQIIMDFTSAGGVSVLDNELYSVFDKSFIGAKGFVEVTSCPIDVSFPNLGEDIGEIQGILSDFSQLYPSYADFNDLKNYDYGYAVDCDSAKSIASWDSYGLYTVNQYGKGLVFFTNPLLPNNYSVSGFGMQYREDSQKTFSNTTASSNQLFVNSIAGYVSKKLYGYYIGRVFGSFGSPDMAWELHYEEITGIENDSMQKFSELCKAYLQVPSFTLIRNSYWWFLRAETVTYYLNEGSNANMKFSMDYYENAYSSGTHIASDNQWLSLASIKDAGSYFVDYPEYTYRAYPEMCDYNEDGVTDIFCGSSDGKIYYYEGQLFDDRLSVSKATILTDSQNQEISVNGYSSPNLVDINGDGYKDIISGDSKGSIYWFSGNGTLAFEPMGILIDTDIAGQCLPSVGDLNNDGILDIAVGSNESILLVFYGASKDDGSLVYSFTNMSALSHSCANANLGKWLAPEICDIDGNGVNELAVGTFDGYVALFENNSNAYTFTKYITIDEMNYKGNNNIKTGNNCVPVFYDINKDDKIDLICGSLEYGLAYPIDSKYFPYAEQLQQQIDYARDNDYYVGVHFYTNLYASERREADELNAHKVAMAYYGIDTEDLGTNQHTWYTSTFSQEQSLLSAWKAGLLWNSGFSAAGSTYKSPQFAAENVISLPFFLLDEGKEAILIQNNSVLPYKGPEWTDISAKYDMPVCVYYHCDLVYKSDVEAKDYLQKVSDFWWKNGYNFAGEDQLIAASAAAYNLTLDVSQSEIPNSNKFNLLLTPGENSNTNALYNESYQKASGAKVVFSEDIDMTELTIDADVWKIEGKTVYIGLNRPVSIKQEGVSTQNHIERINIAANVMLSEQGADIEFLDDGMMQIVVTGSASTISDGWTVSEKDGKTIFTKYGSAQVLSITWKE